MKTSNRTIVFAGCGLFILCATCLTVGAGSFLGFNQLARNDNQAASATETRLTATAFGDVRPVSTVAPDSYEPQTACDHPYYPLRAGTVWNYRVTIGQGRKQTYSVTVDAVTGDLGQATAEISNWWDSGQVDHFRAVCSSDGIQIEEINTEYSSDQHSTYSYPAHNGYTMVVPALFVPGTSWVETSTELADLDDGGKKTTYKYIFTSTRTIEEPQALTLDSGTFEALIVQQVGSVELTISRPGEADKTSTDAINAVNYYAYGIGIVRSKATYRSNDTFTELVGFTPP